MKPTEYVATGIHAATMLTMTAMIIWSGYQDYKTQTLPIRWLLAFYPVLLIDNWLNLTTPQFWGRLIWAALYALVFFINALLFQGGGGDIIFMPLIVLLLPSPISHIVICTGCVMSGLLHLIRMLIFRKQHVGLHDFMPLIPGITVVYLAVLLISTINFLSEVCI